MNPHPVITPIVLTYNDIIKQYGDALLNSLMISQIFFLLLSISITWYTRNWNTKPWTELLNSEVKDTKALNAKLFMAFGWICLPIALYFTLMLIAYKLGVVI